MFPIVEGRRHTPAIVSQVLREPTASTISWQVIVVRRFCDVVHAREAKPARSSRKDQKVVFEMGTASQRGCWLKALASGVGLYRTLMSELTPRVRRRRRDC